MNLKLYNSLVALSGFIGVLFVSLVPPMNIPEGEMNCRFHFMAERSWPFTRTYSVKYPDVEAMLSEYGLIFALCGIFISAGFVYTSARKK